MDALTSFAPLIALVALVCAATTLGTVPIKKFIQVQEAKHELKHGSPGFFRTLSGWIIIVLWLAAIWFIASIIGDWWAFGDLGDAIARSFRRLEILLHILSALGDG